MKNQIGKLSNKIDDIDKKVDFLIESFQSEYSVRKRWLRTNEASEYLGISTSKLHEFKRDGILPVRKLGGTNIYDRVEIDELLTKSDSEV